jgi:hypothetical protein
MPTARRTAYDIEMTRAVAEAVRIPVDCVGRSGHAGTLNNRRSRGQGIRRSRRLGVPLRRDLRA